MSYDFTALHDLHRTAILRYCVWECRDKEVGQDLAQETFIRFWHCLERHDEILHVKAFLYRIAHNLIVDHVRKKRETSLDQLLEKGFEPTIDPWHQTCSRLDMEGPLKQLSELPSAYRHVLHSRVVLDLPPAEIAARTGETSNAVSVRLFRGLKRLRSLINVKYGDSYARYAVPV